MAQKRPRIGVVGSSNVDVVTYIERMPVWGETIAAPVPLAAVLDFSAADVRPPAGGASGCIRRVYFQVKPARRDSPGLACNRTV